MNDVLLGGGKVVGILLESSGMVDCFDWLFVGIGVNFVYYFEDVDNFFLLVLVVGVIGVILMIEEFVIVLVVFYVEYEDSLLIYGFELMWMLWYLCVVKWGDVIIVCIGMDVLSGIFDGIDFDGNLILFSGVGI